MVGSAFLAASGSLGSLLRGSLGLGGLVDDREHGRLPYLAISFLILSAEALMGIPVQWKAKGKRTSSPLSLW